MIEMHNNFKNNKYLLVKSMIPNDICKIATKYAIMQEEVDYTPEDDEYAQVRGSHSRYSDLLMETLQFFLLPKMEKSTGLSLFPTYTYYRIYRPGHELTRHKDRPSCEISTTILLGKFYNNTNSEYNWGMYIDKNSYKIPIAANDNFVSGNNPGTLLKQEVGDAIIYRGCDIEHWRDPLQGDPGTYQVQAFFHYIDKNGPFYPEYAYDKRRGLGYKSGAK
jgi:hypothetical protein